MKEQFLKKSQVTNELKVINDQKAKLVSISKELPASILARLADLNKVRMVEIWS